MSRIDLTEEELAKLLEAVNGGIEPSPELAGKLFPSLLEKLGQAGKFDFETLNRIRIPTIEYAGKRSEGVILASAVALGQSAPLQVVRDFGEPGEDGWQNLIVQGDNLQFLKTVYLNQDPLIRDKVKGKVDLIYIDPPFATKSDFHGGEGAKSYSDKIESAEFLENMRERLLFLRELLSDNGFIFVHVDNKKVHYIKVIMDEIFDFMNFRNEIILPRPFTKNLQQQFQQISSLNVKHDTLLFYSKKSETTFPPIWVDKEEIKHPEGHWHHFWSNADRPTMRYELFGITPTSGQWIWKEEKAKEAIANYERYLKESEGRSLAQYWRDTEMNLRFIRKDEQGKPQSWRPPASQQLADTLWNNLMTYENQKLFPTQKHENLLERIISAFSRAGDLVLDVFGGSGTTAAVAEKLGRRWIICDFGKHAIYIMQKRLLNIADSKAFDAEKKDAKYGKPPKPFAMAAVGAYDFSRVMHLRENKCAYISFVLSLFGIPKEEKNYIEKYKLDHIYAEKDGDPVEIFPVWEDDYLYNVRIDLDYLKDIITQSRGRLKGDYYLVVPETCTQVSDMTLPNGTGGEVYFRFLKFPYSILEQASRKFAIEDQPDTPTNINNLVSSVGFYFNDEVTVKAAKTAQGLKIIDFATPILNRDGAHYHGLSGLSLLLVNLSYNGKVFNMDSAVYAKEIAEGGVIELAGVTGKTAVIAIDRHGNESPPTLISE